MSFWFLWFLPFRFKDKFMRKLRRLFVNLKQLATPHVYGVAL